MKTELELSEMYWKNPEYNERMSFAAFKKLAAVLSESTRPVEDGNFKTEKEAIKWVLHNTPIMVKSVRKCRTKLVFPFRGKSAMNDVCECLGRELFKKQLEAEHMDVSEGKKEE